MDFYHAEREAWRAYQRKLNEFWEAEEKNGHYDLMTKEDPNYEEMDELYYAQWNAYNHFKMVQRQCRRDEIEFHNTPIHLRQPF